MSRNTLLLVDDVETNRAILRALFEQDYNLLEAENGEQALMLLSQYQETIAALLLDVLMPVKDGYEVMADMKKNGLIAKIPVIIITSEDSIENEVRAFDLGASDIIMKPFEPHVVKRRVQNAVELNLHREHLEVLVEQQAVKLRESKDVLMDALSSVIEHRSVESGQHILRIRMFTKILLEVIMRTYPEYDLNERIISIVASASAMHDIGKISIPDAILNKQGRLTEEEFAVMKTHSEKGCEILAGLDRMDDKEYLSYAYNICRYHHERWDGTGYPDGLKGDSIPICAQAVGIADAYDALTTDRVYKKAFSTDKAYSMILNGECGSFSPKLLNCFKSVKDKFAELAHSYADGHSPKADTEKLITVPQIQHTEEQNALQYGQMKYAAMLRYADATVMEVNLDTGTYNLDYAINEDFETLRYGNNYEDELREFVDKFIYIDDKETAYNSIDTYMLDFIENGLLKRTRKYRIFHRTTGEYVWYEVTVLRVNLKDPKSHKVLVVWKMLNEEELTVNELDSKEETSVQNLLIGMQQCVNDKWLTIINFNQGFINLFGYGRDEIESIYHGRFLELIHQDDQMGVLSKIKEQQLLGNSIELEYRVIAKGGHIVWVLDKCQLSINEEGSEILSCVLMDITQVKQAQEELRLTMERHQIIMDQSNDIIFEWDIAEDRLVYSSNWIEKFGYEAISEKVSTRIPQASHLLPEDIPKFVRLVKAISGGLSYSEEEVRIADSNGRYIWCRIRATAQFDSSGSPIKAVGVILDIDSEKRRTQELIDKAERDSLTKLYNKSVARSKIKYILESRDEAEQLAMLIIDIDNFKHINDSRGHMFGDTVLKAIAAKLKKLFRSEDIIARIGGDEFLVFVRNILDINIIKDRAVKVIESFRNIFADELKDCQLSCSIGISLSPQDGMDYQDIFQACDQALYHAKQQGKNQYVMFDRAKMDKSFGINSEQVFAASTRIESDDISEFETYSIIQQAFRVLYEAKDLDMAVNSILRMLGQKYNVSRVYIFENSLDGTHCSNTFEWCNDGIESVMDKLQDLSYTDDLDGNYHENFNENGIFYCPDISELKENQYRILRSQGILSLLQCAVRENGKFIGYVGFDDCMVKRIWTQEQINALAFISELLNTFLLKKQAQVQALESAQNLQMILDNQNSWIYVIDPDTHVLKYINAKTYSIAPDACLGMKCYEAFFKQKKPCEVCPACNIRENINQTIELFNPALNVWSLADASYIRWGGQDACLLSCHDISYYMGKDD